VSADHGENFGELGIYAEHATAAPATCRIPMIVRWTGGRKAAAEPGLVYNLDLTPTVADLLGVAPHPSWDGTSFAGAVRGDGAAGRSHLVLSQGCHVCQRSVLWEGWLYLRTYHDGFHLFPREMLFNLKTDPHEQTDVATRHPEVCAHGARLLMDWHDDMMETQPAGFYHDPLRLVIAEGGPFHAPRSALPAYCKRLEATGRGEAATALRAKYPAAFPKT
jgi:arylsulfatase A-like enzyme